MPAANIGYGFTFEALLEVLPTIWLFRLRTVCNIFIADESCSSIRLRFFRIFVVTTSEASEEELSHVVIISSSLL